MTNTELKKIANNKKITHCYIYKGGYYRPNSCGYTDSMCKAGIYTKEDALRHAEGCRDIKLIPVNIKEHNDVIVKEVNDLLSRYIK